MTPKCEMFMNCSRKFIGICKKKNKNKTNMTAKQGILKGS